MNDTKLGVKQEILCPPFLCTEEFVFFITNMKLLENVRLTSLPTPNEITSISESYELNCLNM